MLKSYLYSRRRVWLTIIGLLLVLAVFFALYELKLAIYWYFVAMVLFVSLLIAIFGYLKFLKAARQLEKQLAGWETDHFTFPKADGLNEQLYQTLTNKLAHQRAELRQQNEITRQDYADYYALWAHQIKTPVAAQNLLLQEKKLNRDELKTQLFYIRQYVDMVLTFTRLQSAGDDLVLKPYDLDEIVRAQIREYAQLFILKKIKVDFKPGGQTVITDSKWLGFVIGQVLSNALKYTPIGGTVKIQTINDQLEISDSGIGINSEDLPRIFERGYTGYNGRADRKATGLGLYLSKKIMTMLGHDILINSDTKHGTKVRLIMPSGQKVIE